MPDSQDRILVEEPAEERAVVPLPVSKPRRFWFRFTLTLGVLMLGSALWLGWYVYSKGFTKKWRNYVSHELRRYGLEITARRITLDPFEGIVARDVTLRRVDAPEGAVLTVTRTALDVSLTELWRGRPFLNSIDLRDATATLPVDSSQPQGQAFVVTKLRARILLPPGQVRVAQAEGECEGIKFSASGLLAFSGETPLFKDDGKLERGVLESRRKLARAVLDEVKKLHFTGDPPRVLIEFSGDMAKPETLTATARVTTGGVQRGRWSLQSLLLAARYEDGRIQIENADVADARGRMRAQADFRPRTGIVSGQIRSDLDLAAALAEFWPGALDYGLSSREPPRIDLTVRARVPGAKDAPPPDAKTPELELVGKLECGALTARGIAFDGLATEFSWRDGNWYLRSGRLVHRSGELRVDAMNAPGQIKAKVTSTIDPDVITPLLPPAARTIMSEFSFPEPPKIEFTAEGKSIFDPLGFTAKGRIDMGRAKFRGVGLNKFTADFDFQKLVLAVRRFTVERDEGRATGDAIIADIGGAELRFENVRAALNPNDVMVWIDQNYPRFTRPYRFKKPPQAKLSGQLQFRGRQGSNFLIEFDAPQGLEYTFAKKNLTIPKLSGQLLFTEHRLQIQNLHGDLFGGGWRGEADIPINRPGIDYSGQVETDGADVEPLTKLFFNYDESKGKLAGKYTWTCRGDDLTTLNGSGTVKVDRGNVFSIPVLGPLSETLSKAAPGLGYNRAEMASGTFTTKDNRMETKDFVVRGKGFSMIGRGWIGYVEDKMDFRIRINAQGLPGVVLYPVSKLFEYRTDGPLAKPVWRPVAGSGEAGQTSVPPGPVLPNAAPVKAAPGKPAPAAVAPPKR